MENEQLITNSEEQAIEQTIEQPELPVITPLKCLYCGIIITEGRKRKFCTMTCRTRHNALNYYHSHKDNADYKVKKREYNKKWRQANPEKWNKMVAKQMKKYNERKREAKAKDNAVKEINQEGVTNGQ